MSGKRQKQLRREKVRREGRAELRVRCDQCGFVQPFTHGNGSRHADGAIDVTACAGCGHHYATYTREEGRPTPGKG